MPTELWIVLAVFGVTIVSLLAVVFVRKYGKDNGVPTEDIEHGIDTAKDAAISEIEKMKDKKNGKENSNS
jgi:hypothetical protein